MAHTRLISLSTLLLTASFAAPELTAQGAVMDTLLRKDGRSDRGVEILSMGLEQVSFRKDGGQVEVPSHEVAGVEWHQPPEEFDLAAAQIARGEYANAAELYREAAGKTIREPLQLEALFLAAQALVNAAHTDASKAAAAESALQSLLADHPDAYRVPDTTLSLGTAMRLGGKGAESEQTLKQMEDRATSDSWGAIWVARARFERALAMLEQDNAAGARDAFKSAASAANAAISAGNTDSALARIKMQAMVGEGETYVRQENYGEALRYFRGLASSAPVSGDTSLAAAAKAGEGEVLFLEAEGKNDVAGLRRAQMALAEATLLDTDGADTSAKSCYYMAKAILALGAPGESENFRARANGYFQILVSQYPGTSWATLARQELGR